MQTNVLDSDEPVIVDYYTPWCGHCHFMEPQFAIAAQVCINLFKNIIHHN